MLAPADWYAKQDLSQHFMRRVDGPFEDGVSRGQLREIKKCEDAGMHRGDADLISCFAIIADNRMRKGRIYGMRLYDVAGLRVDGLLEHFPLHYGSAIAAAALAVKITSEVSYISAWGDSEFAPGFSPVPLLCKEIYHWCQLNGVKTLDIGIAGDENLAAFKRRLGFRRACDAQ